MAAIMAAITSALTAVAEVFGYARDRQKLKNTEPMVKAKAARTEQQEQDKTKKAIANEDLDEIRKQLAE